MFSSVTSNDLIKAIKDLTICKTKGVDNVSVQLLRKSSAVVASILAIFCNQSFDAGTFPDCFKQALVIPIHKKGYAGCISNYGLIALLLVISQLFEKLVHSQISFFLDDNHVKLFNQHVFHKSRSCETAVCKLSSLLSDVKRHLQDYVIVTSDFSRVFDTLNHEVLLSALHTCNFEEKSIYWFKSYLVDRSQQTAYASACSSSRALSSGVSQGSLLGPVLFNLYINSLLYIPPSECTVAYADDVTLVCSGNICTILMHMRSLLDTCYVWASFRRLKLNVSKFFAVYVPTATRATPRDNLHISQLTLDTSPISWLDEMKILGFTFTMALSWSNYANNVKSKISRISGIS